MFPVAGQQHGVAAGICRIGIGGAGEAAGGHLAAQLGGVLQIGFGPAVAIGAGVGATGDGGRAATHRMGEGTGAEVGVAAEVGGNDHLQVLHTWVELGETGCRLAAANGAGGGEWKRPFPPAEAWFGAGCVRLRCAFGDPRWQESACGEVPAGKCLPGGVPAETLFGCADSDTTCGVVQGSIQRGVVGGGGAG